MWEVFQKEGGDVLVVSESTILSAEDTVFEMTCSILFPFHSIVSKIKPKLKA
jgi:hypothetical protein